MHFLVITSAPTLAQNSSFVAYEPYVREINLWTKFVDDFTIISPTIFNNKLLTVNFDKTPKVVSVPNLSFITFKQIFKSLFQIPFILFKIFKACKKADHIHLRCPGNMGLLGCFVQILFPKKNKTAKYAGNWDPNSKQPLSYRFQKYILNSTFLTKNMQVLVYGNWENQTKNIKPFFTASFYDSEIEKPVARNYYNTLNFVFVGSLVKGKRPLLAIKMVEMLKNQGKNAFLELYGDGVLKEELQSYVNDNSLQNIVVLKGNQKKEIIKQALRKAHFLLLPSKSEGWPKAIAEAMFFGAIPVATSISCVPFMLDYGKRGILIQPNASEAVNALKSHLNNQDSLKLMSDLGSKWSQKFTLDTFEKEIAKLLKS